MKELMILLSILVSFPLFMAFSYIVAKSIFPSTETVAAQQVSERQMLLQKAKRVRKTDRVVRARAEREQLVPGQLAHA